MQPQMALHMSWLTLSLAKDMSEGNQPPIHLAPNIMGFTNMDDMMKNLNKMIAGGGMGMMFISRSNFYQTRHA